MDEPTRQFLADAANIRLSPDEKAQFRTELAQLVKEVVPLEELERDPLVKSFLQEAAGISLTMDETEISRHELTHFMTEQVVRSQVGERHSRQMDDRSDVLGDPDKIALSKREHSEARRELIMYMEKKRLEKAEEILPMERLTLREYMHDFWRVVVPRTAILSCAFLIISTSAAFAAEGSLPGDWLYPLKVQVFEQVRGKFIFTPEEKAQWEASRAMRRLEEAAWLAAEDSLTEASWRGLHSNFVEHVVQTEQQIDILIRRGDMSVAEHLSADLDAYLSAHRTVLQSIGLERQSREIENALEHVADMHEEISRRRHERFVKEGEDRAQVKQESAETRIQSAGAELKRAKRDNGLSDSSQASERLERAEGLLLEASSQFSAGLYEEAEHNAREVVKAAAEAKLLRKLPRGEAVEPKLRDDDNDDVNGRAKSVIEEHVVTEENINIDTTESDSSEAVDSENLFKKENESYSLPDDGVEKNPDSQKGVDAADIEAVVPAANVDVNPKGLLP